MRTIEISERTYAAGSQQTSRINLQAGEQRLLVRFTTPGWPTVSDGDITLRFLIDRQGPTGPVQEWSAVFQHALYRGASFLEFEAHLSSPFKPGDDFIVQKDSGVPVTTAITVEIT